MTYEYKTKGTCSSRITFDLDGDVVRNVKFTGGCNGNLKGISAIVVGRKALWRKSLKCSESAPFVRIYSG